MVFAQDMFDIKQKEREFEQGLYKTGFDEFADYFGYDEYDGSIEIYQVPPDARLNVAALKFIKDAGFDQVYITHTDGWESHYNFRLGGLKAKPWRVKYAKKHGNTNTHHIFDPENAS